MKTTSRRNLASLVFIAVLAMVYVAIILLTDRNQAGETSIATPKPLIAASTDSVAISASDSPSDSIDSIKKKRKKSSAKKQQNTPKPPTPNRADVFDRPVEKIK